MQWHALDSTSLAGVAYDATARHLRVRFRNGGDYLYLGVPPTEFHALLAAPSAGAHFNARIRDRYPTVRLARPPPAGALK